MYYRNLKSYYILFKWYYSYNKEFSQPKSEKLYNYWFYNKV